MSVQSRQYNGGIGDQKEGSSKKIRVGLTLRLSWHWIASKKLMASPLEPRVDSILVYAESGNQVTGSFLSCM